MATGLHIGAQMYVSRRRRVLADTAVGEARPGVPMTPDTLMLWMSATKPVTAVCVAQLWERGLLQLDDPVAMHIPAFAAHGKGHITIRHLLTHTAGIRGAAGNWSREPWEAILAKICDARIEPGWVPGRKAGYHLASSWFLLGELIRVLDGRALPQYVREEIFLPLGMRDSWIGIPAQQYTAYGDRMGVLHDTDVGGGEAPRPNTFDNADIAATSRPGGNGRGPARELGRFYEMLLGEGKGEGEGEGEPPGTLNGVRILSPQTVDAMTARQRVGMFDHTFKHVIDWGLGFNVNSKQYGVDTVPYGYGPHASWRTFGHGGSQSSVGFADPSHGLAVAIIFNGTPGDAAHNQRIRSVLGTLYEELELTASAAPVPFPGTLREGLE
jgi:CubicO group peptidase (beta-lactamase class C family)